MLSRSLSSTEVLITATIAAGRQVGLGLAAYRLGLPPNLRFDGP